MYYLLNPVFVMDATFAILVLLSALFAGFLGSILGLGGGALLVPILVIGLDVPILTAIGVSLIGIVANSTIATTNYLKEGYTNIRLGILLVSVTVLGAIIGAFIAIYVFREVLQFIFAIVLFFIAAFMLVFRGKEISVERSGKSDLGLSGEYYDRSIDKRTSYDVTGIKKGMSAGFGAGNLSGILGVGGGIVNVPAMNIWMKVPMKAAVATSQLMVGLTTLAGGLVYYAHGYVDALITVFVVLGCLIGAGTGSRLAPRIKTDALKKAFVVLLIIVAVLMILKSLGILVVA
ncbi:MAG: sulfite exporter TauE/SafE family protein [Thermoplasmata archaeon]|nr:sulfite exporter TauE/SafE family protein [Thermoplasmata archaeon]